MLDTTPTEVRDLLDRSAIEDLVIRYAWANDTWDRDLAVSCFTHDGEFISNGKLLATGSHELGEFFDRGRSGGRLGTMGGTDLIVVSHPMANIVVDLRGDNASVRSASISYTLARSAAGERVFAHALRYVDEARRDDGVWRLRRRTHHLDWQFEVPANRLPGQA